MSSTCNQSSQAALKSLEAAAMSARAGFACEFSSSAEYESALITVRRAQGRYDPPRNPWPAVMLLGTLVLAGTVLLLN